MQMTNHQLRQQQIINKIEKEVKDGFLNFSTVSPGKDYENDSRICLTSVHLPNEKLKLQVQQLLIAPLRRIEADFYYYTSSSLHVTIKNIRIINNPPHFTDEDIENAKKIFSKIIPRHRQFNLYFYRLLLFPNNLALIGTTDPELDNIIFDLNNELNKAGLPDDKIYANSKYFFSNMTLARFNTPPSEEFKQKVLKLSNTIKFDPYVVDSVILLSCNAVFKHRQRIGIWALKENI